MAGVRNSIFPMGHCVEWDWCHSCFHLLVFWPVDSLYKGQSALWKSVMCCIYYILKNSTFCFKVLLLKGHFSCVFRRLFQCSWGRPALGWCGLWFGHWIWWLCAYFSISATIMCGVPCLWTRNLVSLQRVVLADTRWTGKIHQCLE